MKLLLSLLLSVPILAHAQVLVVAEPKHALTFVPPPGSEFCSLYAAGTTNLLTRPARPDTLGCSSMSKQLGLQVLAELRCQDSAGWLTTPAVGLDGLPVVVMTVAYEAGDWNEDGLANVFDVVLMRRWLAGEPEGQLP